MNDQYANIEIGYLLQRIEQYQAIAILATNLHHHLDDAFVRPSHALSLQPSLTAFACLVAGPR